MVRNLMMSLLVLAACTTSGLAGPFSKRPPKPEPAEHVPTLISTLQSEADERKREIAAEELREYDSRTFPDIMPALIEALKNDPSHSVRHEVVNTIGKMRPLSQPAGFALQQAAANDHSYRVRMAAKATLGHWTLLGYRQERLPELNQTEEPPLATPLPKLGPPQKSAAPRSPVPPTPTTKSDAVSPLPPLMPVPAKTTASRSLFPLFSSRSNKPDANEGPQLNPPK